MKFEKSSAISRGLGDALDVIGAAGSLPPIRGTWHFVDPTSGNANGTGRNPRSPVASIKQAYDLCTDAAGDGICLMSRDTGTSSSTTSYLTQELLWTKDSITVYGVAAPVQMFSRARVSSKTITTTATLTAVANTSISRASGSFITDGWEVGMKFITNVDAAAITVTSVSALTIGVSGTLTVGAHTSMTSVMVNLMTISGHNNSFYNVHFYNGGTNALELGGVIVSGNRNYFKSCHIVGGAGSATAAGKFSVEIDAGEENTFEGCSIGSNSFAQGDNAASELLLNGVVKRNFFKGCYFTAMVSAGTAHGAVKSVGTSGGVGTVFWDCIFDYSLSTTTPAAAHLVSGSVDKVVLKDCAAVKVTAWGTSVYANMIAPTAAAGGGLATTA